MIIDCHDHYTTSPPEQQQYRETLLAHLDDPGSVPEFDDEGELEDHLLNNVYFDTCVYHQPGIELLTKVVPTKNILFATEMVGAVKGVDPRTGHNYDDTKHYLDATELTPERRAAIFSENTLRVFPRLKERLSA
jgi:predicted TIM-barrel fold metal-dependent hydrolase